MVKKDREEVQQKGAVGLNSYMTYLTAGWTLFGPIIVVLFFLLSQSLIVGSDYWLSEWATREEKFDLEKTECSANSTLTNIFNATEKCIKFYSNTSNEFDSSKIYEDRTEKFHIYMSKSKTC